MNENTIGSQGEKRGEAWKGRKKGREEGRKDLRQGGRGSRNEGKKDGMIKREI